MNDQPERWRAVGRAIEARMAELRLTSAEMVRRSGVSDKSLAGYIRGTPIRRADKLWAIADALHWTPESIDRILAGEEPEPLSEPDERLRAAPVTKADLDRAVGAISAQLDDIYRYLEALAAAFDVVEDQMGDLVSELESVLPEDSGFSGYFSLRDTWDELRPLTDRRSARRQARRDPPPRLFPVTTDADIVDAFIESDMAATGGEVTGEAREAAAKAAKSGRPGRPRPVAEGDES